MEHDLARCICIPKLSILDYIPSQPTQEKAPKRKNERKENISNTRCDLFCGVAIK